MSDEPNQGDAKPAQPRVSLFGRRVKLRSPAESLQPQAAPPPPPPPPRRLRSESLSRLSGLLSFILIGAIIVFSAFTWAMLESLKPGPLVADKVFIIAREDDAGSIPDQLERAGIIDSPMLFNALVLADGNRSKLKRGEFQFKAGASLRDVEKTIVSGKQVNHRVTIPEGLTSEQVVQRVRDSDVLSGDVKEIPREGSILPESYDFVRGFPRAKILQKMQEDQAKLLQDIWNRRASDLPIHSPGELVILASIVEKETGKPEERPHVASVFINRLRKHMKLESDPTIVYGLVGGKGTLGHSISKSELNQPTLYNTYIIEGLPPTPISNPGKAAMEAVANPSHTSDLFFVADGTGGHAFADTLEQHQKNVLRWRQIEKDAKDRLAPDATPAGPAPAPGAAPAKVHGALEPPADPKAFGALAIVGAAKAVPTEAELARRLARVGANQPSAYASAVDDAGPAPGAVMQTYPLSAAAIAEQQNRAARYGVEGPAAPQAGAKLVAIAENGVSSANHSRAFDASEGTSLDPLLNTTYDLNYPKVVPPMK